MDALIGRTRELAGPAARDGHAGPRSATDAPGTPSSSDGLGGLDELTALYRIAHLGTRREDERQVVNEVLRLVGDVVSCERPLLLLYEPEGDVLLAYRLSGDVESVPVSEPSILRRVFHSGSGEIVNDVMADPDSNPSLSDTFDARHIAVAPLDVAGGRLGVVAAVNSKRGAFAESDLRLLTLLADRAALTLENAKLRSTLERQSQELTGLQRLSRLLASAESVEYAIGESVRIVGDLLDCEKTAILLHEEAVNALVVNPPVEGMSDVEVMGLEISLTEPSLAGTVFRTDTPLLSNDAVNDAWVGEPLRKLLDIDTLLVVPLTSGPRPIGVLMAMNSRRGWFDDNGLRFTTLLGSRISSVIEASRSRERERALLNRLREADRTKTEFVSMLAHELKGPMTTIKGFGEALRDQWDYMPEEKRSRFLDIVSREIGRLSNLVNDLLDVARMESGTLRYDLEPICLRDVVENILAVHPSLSAAHEVATNIPEDVPLVLGDKDRIRQIFLNLLTNASRYAPEGTTITIEAALDVNDPGHVRVSVRDEGIGIAPMDQDRVFSKFVMLPKPGWVKKGTGLGLFITKGIVEAHGGRIWVESEPGAGSTFNLTLQIARTSSAA